MKLKKGVNDLETLYPELVAEWDYENNDGKTPDQFTPGSHQLINWKCTAYGHQWPARIANRTSQNNGCPYCSNKIVLKGFNDLETLKPEIAAEWDYDNNDEKTPDQFTPGSHQQVNWKCKAYGHRWPAKIVDRVCNGNGCPYCGNKKVLKGFNDLETLHPNLAAEWDFENNNGKTPDQFVSGSDNSVSWVCKECGYQWFAKIAKRTAGKNQCPSCTNSRLVPGKNDLASQRPTLAQEWDFEKNTNTPNEVRVYSHDMVHWKCSVCGYTWEARIESRSLGNGCPCCAGRVLIPGKNDLASQYPELAMDWDYSKNDLKPEEVYKSSNNNVYWKCHICGYPRYVSPNSRNGSTYCPCCMGKVLVPQKNDLESQRPELAKDWDYEKNNEVPSQVFVFSNHPAYWKCSICGYEWLANIENRSNGAGCPKCSGKTLVPGTNDLASQRTDLCNEWDFEQNDTTPNEEYVFSHHLVNWVCSLCGHKWKARIEDRSLGTRCPKCSGRKTKKVRKVM